VAPAERVVPLDVLRGAALLGILTMNIRFFADVTAVYENPTAHGDLRGANYLAWYLPALLADTKFMAIFSMLFGAGIVLMAGRQEQAGRPPLAVHLRRMAVLLGFGLAHAWLVWAGDILYSYALCGVAVYPFRRARPAALVILGLLVLAIGSSISLVLYGSLQDYPPARADMQEDFQPSAQAIQAEIESYRGGWREQNAARWQVASAMETVEFVVYIAWRAGGLMLIGMALFKLRVFDASRPRAFYLALMAAGVLVGLPVVAYGIRQMEASGWEVAYCRFLGSQFNYWGSLPVAGAWVGLVMLACQSVRLRRATAPLAAVGRMALTNYLMQSLVCTWAFYGHGLGLFARLDRVAQMGVVAAVWALQLAVSPLWLWYFRLGPAEWLWRTLTYGRLQPLLYRKEDLVGLPIVSAAASHEGSSPSPAVAMQAGEQGGHGR
jgi:uncharacterized protein